MEKINFNIQLFATNETLATLSGSYKTKYTVTWSLLSQDVVTNKSKIRIYGTLTTGNTTYIGSWYNADKFTLNGIKVHGGWEKPAGTSGTVTVWEEYIDIEVTHNTDGSFPDTTVTYSAYDHIAFTTEQSGSATIIGVPTIPRTSILNKPSNFNIGSTIKLNVTKYSSTFTDTLVISLNNTTIKTIQDYKSGNAITFTQAELNTIYGLLPNTNKGTFTFVLSTKNASNTTIGKSTQTAVGTIINANPIFNDFDFSDINPKTVKLLEGGSATSSQSVILGYSNVQVTIPVENKAVAQKQATMIKYRFNNIEANYSESSDVSITSNAVTSGDFTVYAIDSRGNSKPVAKSSINVINYKPLKKGNIMVERQNGVSENVILEFNATIDLINFGAKTNSIMSARYRYKKASSNQWSTLENLTVQVSENGQITFNDSIKGDLGTSGFDIQDAYNIEVYLKDELSQIKFTANFGAGIPHIAYAKNGVGIMGKYDESVGGLLQVGGKKIGVQIGDVYITSTNKNPASYLGGNWSLKNKEFSYLMDTFTSDETSDYFTMSENVSNASLGLVRNGNMLHLRLFVTLATELTDTNLELGTFNLENLGISRFSLTRYGQVAGSDSGDCYIVYQLTYQGVLTIIDVLTKDNTHALASGKTFYFDIMSVIYGSAMLDSVSNKFYWERTA